MTERRKLEIQLTIAKSEQELFWKFQGGAIPFGSPAAMKSVELISRVKALEIMLEAMDEEEADMLANPEIDSKPIITEKLERAQRKACAFMDYYGSRPILIGSPEHEEVDKIYNEISDLETLLATMDEAGVVVPEVEAPSTEKRRFVPGEKSKLAREFIVEFQQQHDSQDSPLVFQTEAKAFWERRIRNIFEDYPFEAFLDLSKKRKNN